MIDRTGPISERGHQDLTAPRVLECNLFHGYVFYGYGWGTETYRAHKIITHNGVETGVRCLMQY